jgi:outer membrane protein TolC
MNLIARLSFFLIFAISLSAQSLNQLIDRALEYNLAIKQEKQAVGESELTAEAVSAKNLPTLDFDASFKYITEVAQIDFSKIPVVPLDKITLGSKENYDLGLGINYVVFSGFAQSALEELSQKKVGLAKISLESKQKEIALKIIKLYRQYQMVSLARQTVETAYSRTKLKLNKVKTAVENGFVLGVDTLSLKLALNKFEQNMLSLENQLESIKNSLEVETGAEVTVTNFNVSTPVEAPGKYLAGQQMGLKTIAQLSRMVEVQGKIIESSLYPKMALQASYKYGKPGVDIIKNEWIGYGVLGIGVQWNLWSWNAHSKEAQANKLARDQLKTKQESLGADLRLKYDDAVRNYKNALKMLKVLETAQSLAKEKFTVTEVQYDEGNKTITEFNESNLEVTEAALNYKKQRVEIALLQSTIDFLSGSPVNEWRLNQ